MREHYNTDGIRISTTERYYFFYTIFLMPTQLLASAAFLYFYERKLDNWNEKKIGRLVTHNPGEKFIKMLVR